MKSMIKENNNFLISLFIYIWQQSQQHQKQQKADDGYNGKSLQTLVQIKSQQIKKTQKSF